MAIKILIGGSPCTYWSIAQTNNRETKAEGMGWELFKNYLIAKEKFKPDFFLYENNKSAAQAIKDQIAEEFGVGVDPNVRFTYINSALVSAQNRQRFYVTNFGDIEQPEDRGILLKDILETGQSRYEKSPCIDANYHKGGNLTRPECQSGQRLMACEQVVPFVEERLDGIVDKLGYLPEMFNPYNLSEITDKAPTQTAQCASQTKSSTVMMVQSVRIPEYGESNKSRPLNASYAHKGSGEGSLKSDAFPDNPNKQVFDYVAEPLSPSPVNETADGKAQCVRATCYKDGVRNLVGNEYDKRTCVAEPLNITPEGKSQTIKAQYQQTSPANILGYTSTYGATGVAEPIRVGSLPRPNGELSKSPTQMAGGGGAGAKTGLYAIRVDEPMRVNEATKQGYVDINVGDCVDLTQPNSKTRRGRSLIDKSNCLTTSHQQYEYCGVLGYATPVEWDDNGVPTKATSCADGKVYTVYEVKDGQITIKGKQYPIKLIDGYYIIRKLTVRECARLQTMPDDYCKAVSDSQAYKALGNGWTAEVIIHLLNHALKDVPRDEEIVVLSMYDGIATGRYCLDKMGFTNVAYHAYEIDKYPIQVAMDNYPDIIQHGDAFAVREDDWKAPQTRSEWLDELLGDAV